MSDEERRVEGADIDRGSFLKCFFVLVCVIFVQ